MWIELQNCRARVVRATEEELAWIDSYLSFPDNKARFRRGGTQDIHLLESVSRTFPAGFLSMLRGAAAKDGIVVELADIRQAPCPPTPTPGLGWLLPHQREAVELARTHERGIFHHVTASGKTEIIVALGELYPCSWLVVTHSKDICAQVIERYSKRTGERVGVVGDNAFSTGRVTVAMFQSLFAGIKRGDARMLNLVHTAEAIAADECHLVAATTFYRVLMECRNAYLRYGFSGTPLARGDDKSIYVVAALGPVIHRVDAQRLIDAGLIARPRIKMIHCMSVPTSGAVTWAQVYTDSIVNNAARHALIVSLAQRAAKPCLILVERVNHGKLIERALRKAGVVSEFVWGENETPSRRAAIRRLEHGDSDVLIANRIFTTGVDIPSLGSVIVASAMKSTILTLQAVGRGMRRAPGKSEVEIWDIADSGHRWHDQHTRARLRAYASEHYDIVEHTA